MIVHVSFLCTEFFLYSFPYAGSSDSNHRELGKRLASDTMKCGCFVFICYSFFFNMRDQNNSFPPVTPMYKMPFLYEKDLYCLKKILRNNNFFSSPFTFFLEKM